MSGQRGNNKKKVDNDHQPSKIAVRRLAVESLGEPRPIRVLDAYHGYGKMWEKMGDAMPDWTFNVYGVDNQHRGAGTIRADNVRLLEALDLSKFDLIDLDAYGWPTKQLRLVAAGAPDVAVVTTRIHQRLGQVPHDILDDLNFALPKAVPTLLQRLSEELWEAWLHHLGYRTAMSCIFDHSSISGPGGGQVIKRYEYLSRQE